MIDAEMASALIAHIQNRSDDANGSYRPQPEQWLAKGRWDHSMVGKREDAEGVYA